MLQVAEAQERILAGLVPTPVEWVALPQAAGRVLAGDLHAKRDQPPVAVSAMDGYAVRAADTVEPGRRFRLIGEATAGGQGTAGLAPGETVRIFTGGAVPPGADAIVIQENADRRGRRGPVQRCRERRHFRSRRQGSISPVAGPGWPQARCSTRAALGSPPRWAICGCPYGGGRGSACSPPATSCAGPARRPKAARSRAPTP